MPALSGIDHALAMFAIGIWAAQIGGRAVWAIPFIFITAMIAGIIAVLSGLMIPNPQMGSAMSVLLLGLFIMFKLKTLLPIDMFIAGAFALFHGYARGPDLLMTAPWLYTTGYVGASIMLHLAGVFIGQHIKWTRYTGYVIAIAGIVLVGVAGFNIIKSIT